MGSIRRSVERLRSRATRRSASVPDNLNILDDSDDFGFRPASAGPDGECYKTERTFMKYILLFRLWQFRNFCGLVSSSFFLLMVLFRKEDTEAYTINSKLKI